MPKERPPAANTLAVENSRPNRRAAVRHQASPLRRITATVEARSVIRPECSENRFPEVVLPRALAVAKSLALYRERPVGESLGAEG